MSPERIFGIQRGDFIVVAKHIEGLAAPGAIGRVWRVSTFGIVVNFGNFATILYHDNNNQPEYEHCGSAA